MRTKPDWQFESASSPEQWTRTALVVRVILLITLVNLLVIVAAPLSSMYANIPGYPAFRVMFYAMQLGILLAAIGFCISIFSIIKEIPKLTRQGLICLLIGLVPPLAAIVSIGINGLRSPMIHDITTDIVDPPEFQEARLLRTTDQNPIEYEGLSLAEIQQRAYPDIRPLISGLSRDDALIEATQVVKDLQWEFINLDYDNGIIEAYDTSRIFGFIDDIVIRIRSEGRGSRIDLRSTSRVGKGDLGKNAERIKTFINSFRG